ncbi:MAG: hypothetical protein J7L63_05060 [Thermoplasmata archaeon]|nr:hypothetical protein [Thermoplasmata archaeon]
MKRAEKEIIKALLKLQREEIEITASGLVMILDLDITPREASWILKRLAKEIIKDKYFNQNLYVINLEAIRNEEGSGILASE